MTDPRLVHAFNCLNQAITLLAEATDLSREEVLEIVQERAQLPRKLVENPCAKAEIIGKVVEMP